MVEHAGEVGTADSAGRAVCGEGREEGGTQAARVEGVTVGVTVGVAVDTEAGEEWKPDALEEGVGSRAGREREVGVCD